MKFKAELDFEEVAATLREDIRTKMGAAPSEVKIGESLVFVWNEVGGVTVSFAGKELYKTPRVEVAR